jgi:PKD repeat protein
MIVSDQHPRQRHGVLFDASSSSSDAAIVSYTFNYGDGIQESSYQPQMSHAYSVPGAYQATVTILDANGGTATSPAVTVYVRDGVPPVVRINSPRSGQTAHLRHSGFVISGTAVDPGPGASGVRIVELGLVFLSVPPGFNGCPWFDGQHALKVRLCNSPLWFGAKLGNGTFSFRLNPHLAWPTGQYAVRVRGIDWAGNVSDTFAVKLRTILAFRLTR